MAPNEPYSKRLFSQVERLKIAGFTPIPCFPLGKTPDCNKNETWEMAQGKQWKADHNVGLCCKSNKIVVLDIDTVENAIQGSETDPERFENALINTFPELRNAPQEITPSGGKHYFFKADEKSIKKCMTGALTINVGGEDVKLSVDIKAPGEGDDKGGLIVIAPSRYPLENGKMWKNKFGGMEYKEVIPILSDNLIPMSEFMVAMFENHNIDYYKDINGVEKITIIDNNPMYLIHNSGITANGNIIRNKECLELILKNIPVQSINDYDNWLKNAVIPIINAFSKDKEGSVVSVDLFELMERYLNPEGKHDKNQNMLKYLQILTENKSARSIGSLMFLIKQNNENKFKDLVSEMRNKGFIMFNDIKMEFTHINQINDIPDDASVETAKLFIKNTIRYVENNGSPYYLVRAIEEKNEDEMDRKAVNNEAETKDDFIIKWLTRSIDQFEKHVLKPKCAKTIIDGKSTNKSYYAISKDMRSEIKISKHINKPYTPLEDKKWFERGGVLNIFPGYVASLVDIDTANNNRNVDLIFSHIKSVWCCGDVAKYNYVINWLAFNLQKPRQKPEYGLVLRDIFKGSGKSRIIELMIKYIYGECGLVYNGLDEYLDPYNSRRERGLLVFIDEVENIHTHAKKMKRYHTNKSDTIRLLYENPRDINNYNAFIYCTNNDHVLKSESGDRRFFCLSVSNIMKDNHEYFRKFELLNQHDWNCYYTIMMNRDLSKFEPRKPHMTEEKEDNIIANIDMATKYFVESLLSTDKPSWMSESDGLIKFHINGMYNTVEGGSNFRKYCENNGIQNVPTKSGMEVTLIRSLGKTIRIQINGIRSSGYSMSLENIKKKMIEYHGEQIVERLFNDNV